MERKNGTRSSEQCPFNPVRSRRSVHALLMADIGVLSAV